MRQHSTSLLQPHSVELDTSAVAPDALAQERAIRRRLDAQSRERIFKRVIDIALGSIGLMALLPVLALVALAIEIDSPGPVLFRQVRIGKHGRPFVMLKFRTMIADRRRRDIGPPPGVPERRRVHKSPSDPRITAVGRFLRRSCLDELPQLWNVLAGSMSLVGPRPELPGIVAGYEPWQHLRLLVAPGITGWWQVNRDGVRLMHEATELDLFYLENWSVALDLLILTRTIKIVLRGVGAF
jgi:lipopolysaccharide/colanic/teichoic acid biosynthesis glycosyltransferase